MCIGFYFFFFYYLKLLITFSPIFNIRINDACIGVALYCKMALYLFLSLIIIHLKSVFYARFLRNDGQRTCCDFFLVFTIFLFLSSVCVEKLSMVLVTSAPSLSTNTLAIFKGEFFELTKNNNIFCFL